MNPARRWAAAAWYLGGLARVSLMALYMIVGAMVYALVTDSAGIPQMAMAALVVAAVGAVSASASLRLKRLSRAAVREQIGVRL